MSSENPKAGTRSDEIVDYPFPEEDLRDGIGEEDNKIPLWFNATFIGTIIIAFIYVPYHHFYLGWSAASQYEAEVAAAEAKAAVVQASLPATNPYAGDSAAMADGQQTFATICAACHKPDGSGLVGPSLVDPYWKYGDTDADRFQSVAEGRPGGMPPWKTQLGTEKIWKVLAYQDSLPKSSEPGVGSPEHDAAAAAAAPGAGS